MIVEPKVKGFICTTAHPAGCKESVRRQIAYCKEKGMVEGPKKVLVIGSSTGYGLASRIAVTYGYGADTIGVAFERPMEEERQLPAGITQRHLKSLPKKTVIMQSHLMVTVFRKK